MILIAVSTLIWLCKETRTWSARILGCVREKLLRSTTLIHALQSYWIYKHSNRTVSGYVPPSPCRPKLRRPNLSYVTPTSKLCRPNIQVLSPQLNFESILWKSTFHAGNAICFHPESDGSTFPHQSRHQTAVRAPATNRQYSNSPGVHELLIEYVDTRF